MKDARSRESRTLSFVTFSWLAVFARFLAGGLNLPWFQVPAMSATEFAAAGAAILAIWLGREWQVRHYEGQRDEAG